MQENRGDAFWGEGTRCLRSAAPARPSTRSAASCCATQTYAMRIWTETTSASACATAVGKISTAIRKPDQIIQPWQFGHGEIKTTCLWLKGLPLLVPTSIAEGREQKCWKMPARASRGKDRSRTYRGIAEAMADQWGRR